MSDPNPPRPRDSLRRRAQRAGILPATAMVLLALLAGAATIWVFFTRLLRDAWPWQLGGLETTTPGFQLMQLVLTLIGGIGAAILVVVAYRRQRDLETARFDDRFAAAAAQLGADTAAERLAGVYAMAALADTWEQHRQQCINVLCAYLRLPYDPSTGLLAEVVSEHTWPVGAGTGRESRTYRTLPNDREVRHTIIRVITEHLRDTATTSWQGHDFDFTSTVFDGGDFSQARFIGGRVSFAEAVFATGHLRFFETEFNADVSFIDSRFRGGQVTFTRSKFLKSVSFRKSQFTGGTVWFTTARFDAGDVDFVRARFEGADVWFWRTVFAGSRVSFDDAHFTAGQVLFDRAQFDAGATTFDAVKLTTGLVTLYGSKGNAWPTSDGARFEGWPTPERHHVEPNSPSSGDQIGR